MQAADAVWRLTDNHDVHSIYSTDTTMMYDLRRFVAKAKNLPLASIYEKEPQAAAPVTYTHPLCLFQCVG